MILLMAYDLDNMLVRLIDEAEMENTRDWLSRLIEDPEGGPTRLLIAGDIPSFPHGSAHALHDGSDAAPAPARYACGLLLTVDSGNLLPGCYCYKPSELRACASDVAREGDQSTAREI